MNEICIRNINGTEIAVNITKPSSLMFRPDYIRKHNIDLKNCSLVEIEKLLKGSSDFLPLNLTIELTSRCNLNCEFCYIHNHVNSADVSFEIAKPYFDYLIDKGLIKVVLTGGECTINKDFLKIYTYFKSNGVLVDVYTNGIFLSSEILKTFEIYSPRRVEISIYNSFHKDPRPYFTALTLQKLGIEVLIKLTVTTQTYSLFKDLQNWCITNNFCFKFDTDISDAYDDTNTSIYELPEKIKVSLDKERYTLSAALYNDITCFSCGPGNISLHINSNFELGLCTKTSERFKLICSTMDTAYNNLLSLINKFKGIKFENCTNCFARPICRMCYARAKKELNENGDIILCASEEFCKKTQNYFKKLFY